MKIPKRANICEVGFRDGLQNEKIIVDIDTKLELIRQTIDAGIKTIELGSFVNPKAVPQMADTDELFTRLSDLAKADCEIEFRALIANLRGVERAIKCGCKKVKLNVSASKAHNLANLNMTPEESVAKFHDCQELAKEHDIEVSGSISMPFGSPWENEIPIDDIFSIMDAYYNVGVMEISLSDTSGMATPMQVFNICSAVKRRYSDIILWLHFHNTRGMAMANIVAAMQCGVVNFDASLAGLGGCPFVPKAAGNIATEDVVYMLDNMNVANGIDLGKLLPISQRLKSIFMHDMDSYQLKIFEAKQDCHEAEQ